jgi:hypothetical protein
MDERYVYGCGNIERSDKRFLNPIGNSAKLETRAVFLLLVICNAADIVEPFKKMQ